MFAALQVNFLILNSLSTLNSEVHKKKTDINNLSVITKTRLTGLTWCCSRHNVTLLEPTETSSTGDQMLGSTT